LDEPSQLARSSKVNMRLDASAASRFFLDE